MAVGLWSSQLISETVTIIFITHKIQTIDHAWKTPNPQKTAQTSLIDQALIGLTSDNDSLEMTQALS